MVCGKHVSASCLSRISAIKGLRRDVVVGGECGGSREWFRFGNLSDVAMPKGVTDPQRRSCSQ